MAIYLWSSLNDGDVLAFDPNVDVLRFDYYAISAPAVAITQGASTVSFTYGGKTVTLSTAPATLTTTNVLFANGGQLVVGDNTTGTANDDLDNSLFSLPPGPSQLLGLGGNDFISGSGGNDRLDGGSGADTLQGSSGNDTLDGGSGDDSLAGGSGDDTFIVDSAGDAVTDGTFEGSGDRVLASVNYTLGANIEGLVLTGAATTGSGNTLNNFITGNALANSLSGADGDDTLSGGAGGDTLDGGTGTKDAADYSAAPGPVTVNLAAGTVSGADGTDALLNIESAIGSAYDDLLVGSGGDNTLRGGAGSDTFDGGAGAGDTADYSQAPGAVTVNLGAGLAAGADGSDTLSGIENVVGGAYDDHLIGNGGSNTLAGGAGADTLDGAAGADTADYIAFTAPFIFYPGIKAELAAGVADVKGQAEVLISIEGVIGTAYTDFIVGTSGDDRLFGAGGSDWIEGGAGNDYLDAGESGGFLIGGAGDDTLVGSTSADTASYAGASSAVTVNIATGTASGGAGNDTLPLGGPVAPPRIENVVGSPFNDHITGDSGTNAFAGGAGNDTLDGGSGVTDVAQYHDAAGSVTVNLFAGTATGASGNDMLLNIEYILGSSFDDVLTGSSVANQIQGGAGNDTLEGGAGNDVLDGQSGHNVLAGGDGSDFLTNTTGTGVASYATAASGVNASLAAGTASGGGGSDSFGGGIVGVIGTGFNDTLTGSASDNLLAGGAGSDTLDGGAGNDTADYSAAMGAVAVDLGAGTAGGADGSDVLSSIERVLGSAFDDMLTGGTGNDTVAGGAGNDTLSGGAGNDRFIDSEGANLVSGGDGDDVFEVRVIGGGDTVTGGADQDIYLLSGADGTQYLVTDFVVGADGDIIDVWALLGRSAEFGYAGGNAFDAGTGFLRLVQSGANTLFEWDADGAAGGAHAWVTQLVLKDTSAATLAIGNIRGPNGVLLDGTIWSDAIDGLSLDDRISGFEGNDTLRGAAGNDLLNGGPGKDNLNGGTGDDIVLGGDGADFLDGGGDSDSLFGGAGDDTLQNGAVLDGGEGNDLIEIHGVMVAAGGAGTDTFVARSDVVSGVRTRGVVTDFSAGAGGDLINVDFVVANTIGSRSNYGWENPFHPSPGLGELRLMQSGSDTLLQFNFGGSEWDTILELENISAGSLTADNFVGRIPLNGTSVPGLAIAGTGIGEEIRGGIGYDTVSGGDGDDQIFGSYGSDVLDGGLGNDKLWGDNGVDRLNGGDGHDELQGGTGYDTLEGGAGDDVLLAPSTFGPVDNEGDLLSGGDGDDTLYASGSNHIDTVLGGTGNDRFIVSPSGHLIDGGDGADNFEFDAIAPHTVTGGQGQDSYSFLSLATTGTAITIQDFTTGAGGDQIDVSELLLVWTTGTAGGFQGGNPISQHYMKFEQSGADTLVLFDRDGAEAAYAWTILANLNNVSAAALTAENFFGGFPEDGSPPPPVTLSLTAAADTRYGRFGVESISALDGDDFVTGSWGGDTLDGGNGDDSLKGEANDDSVVGGDGNDTLSGGDGNDTVRGGLGDDQLSGDGGVDALFGGDGFDRFVVGAGASEMSGEGGLDTYVVAAASSAAVTDFAAGPGGDMIDVLAALNGSVQYGYSGSNPFESNPGFLQLLQSGNDTLLQWDRDGAAGGAYNWVTLLTLRNVAPASVGNDNFVGKIIIGTPDDDVLIGEFTNDILIGLAGNDVLDGRQGADTMRGGTGNDLYYVDSTSDAVEETSNSPSGLLAPIASLSLDGITDTVRATVDYALTAFVENLTLIGDALAGTGNELFNTITGNELGNTLRGLAGNDSIDGVGGVDTMEGGSGDDLYFVDHASDLVVETSNDPAPSSSPGEPGAISVEGITDTVVAAVNYSLDGAAYVENLTLASTVTLAEGETPATDATGNGLDNVLTGNELDNLLEGLAGNDTLIGSGGDDTLVGGLGTDTLMGGAGSNLYLMDAGDVVVDGGSPDDTVLAEFTFTLTAGLENLVLGGGSLIDGRGNAANNRITGNSAANTIEGFDGNDSLVGGAGNDRFDWNGASRGGIDTMAGGPGDDQYSLSSGDVVTELIGEGVDTVWVDFAGLYVLGTHLEHLTIWGSSAGVNGRGNGLGNTILGNGADNSLEGGAGNDSLVGGAGNDLFDWTGSLRGGIDTMRGGAGDDQYSLSAGDVVIEFSGEGNDTAWVDFAGTYLLPANVENLTLWSAAAGVNGRGNAANNVIIGNSAANTLDGGDGNDSLVGGAGNDLFDWTSSLRGGIDTMRGGAGDDQYSITNGDYVIENAGEGTDTVWVDFAGTYVLGPTVENLSLWGSAAGVNGTGNPGNNVITGSSQANTLNGAAGNDTLNGGAGNDLFDWTSSLRTGIDWMYGRQGDDQFNVSPGDVVQEFFGEGTDTVWVDFAGTYILGPTLENLTLWGSTAGVNGTGNAANNAINGNSAANTLNGSGGNDSLVGGAGNDLFDWTSSLRTGIDTMRGGPGDDQFNLSSGDLVIENAGEGTDTAWVDFTGYVLPLYVENLTLWGGSAINGTGNGGNNTLTGNSAANGLDGEGGNDTINGGAGADTLIGGTGDDTLIYDAADASVQGGVGTDTYRIAVAGATLNLAGLAGVSRTGLEVIDLTGTGNNTLTVNLADVLAISDTTDTLRVDGNAGDVVNAGTGWTDAGSASGYHIYAQGAATLIVDEDVARNVFT